MAKYRIRTYNYDMVGAFDIATESEDHAIEVAKKIIPPSYVRDIDVINFEAPASDEWEIFYRRDCPWEAGRVWLSSPSDTVKVVLNKSQIALISEGLNYYRKFLGRKSIKDIAKDINIPVEYLYQLGFYANDKYRRD